MLKKLVVAAALTGLVASPVAAADQAPATHLASSEIVPAAETVDGLPSFFNQTGGPLIMFAIIVAIGVGIALLIKTDDEPASP